MKRVSILAVLLLVLLAGVLALDQDNTAKAATSDIVSVRYVPASPIVFEEAYQSGYEANYEYVPGTDEVKRRFMPKETIPEDQLNQVGDKLYITLSSGETLAYEMSASHDECDKIVPGSYYLINNEGVGLSELFDKPGQWSGIRVYTDIEKDDWKIGKNKLVRNCSFYGYNSEYDSDPYSSKRWIREEITSCPITIEFTVEENSIESVEYVTHKEWKANWIEDSSRAEGGYYEKAKHPYENRFPYDGDELIVTKKDGTTTTYKGEWWNDPCWEYWQFDFRNVNDYSDKIIVIDYNSIIGYLYAPDHRNAWLGKESAFLLSKSLYDSTADKSQATIMYAGHIIEPVVKEKEDGDDPGQKQQDPSQGDSKVPLTNVVIGQIAPQDYTGSLITPAISITANGAQLRKNVDYTVDYSNNRNAGTAKAVIKGAGKYTGTLTTFFTINKAPNTMKAKALTANVKAKKLKRSKQTVKLSCLVKVTKAKGKVTYSVKPANTKAQRTIKYKNGKVQIRKGTKKGTYKVRIKVKAAGESNYKPLSKAVTAKIRVK